MSAAETNIVTNCLGTVCPVPTATYTRGRTELLTLTAQSLLWSVGHACPGELRADNTIFKFFNVIL
jgi:hypothetical protein